MSPAPRHDAADRGCGALLPALMRALVPVLCAGLAGCDRAAPPAPAADAAPPAAPAAASTRALDAGAALLQRRPPVDALNAYLDGFHFVAGRLGEQMPAHHFCATLDEDFTQCVIFDGHEADARLVGIEYVLSARRFAELPQAEKALWHSHVHEVHSGQLVAPGLPQAAEHALMRRLVGTYGKTWHVWQRHHGDALPLGLPRLMMGFTADGQADAAMVAERDSRLGIDSARRRAEREDIARPPIDPDADAWQRGPALQLRTVPVEPAAAGSGALR